MRELIRTIGGVKVYRAGDAVLYMSGLAVDADGSPHAYHPQPGKGLDKLSSAGHSGNWWGLVTEGGHPVVQGAGDPAPGYYVSTTSLVDPTKGLRDPHRYVNAEVVPYTVLPARANLGLELGDLVYVSRPSVSKSCGAIIADVGPAGQIGEGSIALAQALAVPSNPLTGGAEAGIVYLCFPGTLLCWPQEIAHIQTCAQKLFAHWGGRAQLRATLPEAFSRS